VHSFSSISFVKTESQNTGDGGSRHYTGDYSSWAPMPAACASTDAVKIGKETGIPTRRHQRCRRSREGSLPLLRGRSQVRRLVGDGLTAEPHAGYKFAHGITRNRSATCTRCRPFPLSFKRGFGIERG
jgi:hypothetical protein